MEKQSSRVAPRKPHFDNMQQIYRITPMSKCDFNKVAATLFKLHFNMVNLLHIFRTPCCKNTSGWLLLNLGICTK